VTGEVDMQMLFQWSCSSSAAP